MKHADLTVLTKDGTGSLKSLVQRCSFEFTRWDEVAQHEMFSEQDAALQQMEVSYVVLDETSPAMQA